MSNEPKTGGAGAALDRRRENGDVARSTLADDIRKMQDQFQLAMPRGAEAGQLVRDALTAVRKTKHLDQCESVAVLGSLMTCAQLGLRVGVLGQAWVLPFWDKRAGIYQAQLIIGYQGYTELAHRSPKMASFIPRVVYENDDFDIDYGVQGTLVHKPPKTGPRGKAVGYHSIARYSNGGYDFLHMTQEEMDEHRDRFATTRRKDGSIFGPWIDHPQAMGQKTTQRLLAKYIPKSPELVVASYVDGGLRLDLNPKHAPEEVTEPIDVTDVMDGQVVEPEGRPDDSEPINDAARKWLMATCTQAELADRDKRLAYATEVLGRPVETFNSLTMGEARRIGEALQRFIDQSAGPR